MHVDGPDYRDNDHVAFAEDLERLHALGVRLVPLHDVVHALVEHQLPDLHGAVAITFDDGSDLDCYDLPHPRWGPQRGMLNVLRHFRAKHGAEAQPALHATTFVIVSPEARANLDATCLIGCRWWNDDWWQDAEASGLMAVESHSWDHNHETLESSATSAPRGGFQVMQRDEADAEIAKASRFLRERRGRDEDVLFACPYGDCSRYLIEEYFPDSRANHGVYAAFSTKGSPVSPGTSRWEIPRFVCASDWKSPEDLEKLLSDCGTLRRPGGLGRLFQRRQRVLPSDSVPHDSPDPGWRDCLRTWEVNDANHVAGDLFRNSFGHDVPDYPRHFVLMYSPPPGAIDEAPRVVAYVHQLPYEGAHLCGGMCVDPAAYRRFSKRLFDEVRREGGLATIVTRDSIGMLGEGDAVFGHVGEPRARAADLRTGFVDTGRPPLMAVWRKPLSEEAKQRWLDRIEGIGPF